MPVHSRYKHRKPIAEINVVPYIDVMLVLLVIFMIAAPLLSQGVNVNLPQASAKQLANKQEPIIVSIDKNGQFYLNIADQPKQSLSAKALQMQIENQIALNKQNNQSREVYVKGDRDVDYGKVVEAMVLLQKAGVENVGLITQPIAQ